MKNDTEDVEEVEEGQEPDVVVHGLLEVAHEALRVLLRLLANAIYEVIHALEKRLIQCKEEYNNGDIDGVQDIFDLLPRDVECVRSFANHSRKIAQISSNKQTMTYSILDKL